MRATAIAYRDTAGKMTVGIGRNLTDVPFSPDEIEIMDDACRFLDEWGVQAAALGWGTLDIFGAHPTHPVQRIDCAGLIVILGGADVIAVSAGTIRTRNRSGAKLSYRRRPLPGAAPLWRLR